MNGPPRKRRRISPRIISKFDTPRNARSKYLPVSVDPMYPRPSKIRKNQIPRIGDLCAGLEVAEISNCIAIERFDQDHPNQGKDHFKQQCLERKIWEQLPGYREFEKFQIIQQTRDYAEFESLNWCTTMTKAVMGIISDFAHLQYMPSFTEAMINQAKGMGANYVSTVPNSVVIDNINQGIHTLRNGPNNNLKMIHENNGHCMFLPDPTSYTPITRKVAIENRQGIDMVVMAAIIPFLRGNQMNEYFNPKDRKEWKIKSEDHASFAVVIYQTLILNAKNGVKMMKLKFELNRKFTAEIIMHSNNAEDYKMNLMVAGSRYSKEYHHKYCEAVSNKSKILYAPLKDKQGQIVDESAFLHAPSSFGISMNFRIIMEEQEDIGNIVSCNHQPPERLYRQDELEQIEASKCMKHDRPHLGIKGVCAHPEIPLTGAIMKCEEVIERAIDPPALPTATVSKRAILGFHQDTFADRKDRDIGLAQYVMEFVKYHGLDMQWANINVTLPSYLVIVHLDDDIKMHEWVALDEDDRTIYEMVEHMYDIHKNAVWWPRIYNKFNANLQDKKEDEIGMEIHACDKRIK